MWRSAWLIAVSVPGAVGGIPESGVRTIAVAAPYQNCGSRARMRPLRDREAIYVRFGEGRVRARQGAVEGRHFRVVPRAQSGRRLRKGRAVQQGGGEVCRGGGCPRFGFGARPPLGFSPDPTKPVAEAVPDTPP